MSDNDRIQLLGSPCGSHGPYTFYKAFKYCKNGRERVVCLSEFFFVKLWIDSDLVCIGELQLLWVDKNSEQVLASLRLYFLPEHTPEGRAEHGEDEVLSISEKVVLRLDDLVTWITVDTEWTWGRLAMYRKDSFSQTRGEYKPVPPLEGTNVDMSDVEKERHSINSNLPLDTASVIVMSYPKYCRYRAIMKGVEDSCDDIPEKVLRALGGFTVSNTNTRIMFCRDIFDYPDLEGHELLCNHLAPKLKGRPRGKRKKLRSYSPGSESNESESSVSNVFNSSKAKDLEAGPSSRRTTRNSADNPESKIFVNKLISFMKEKQTPIGRIPSLGFKELDLQSFYLKVQKFGGYDSVTSNKQWKNVYDEMTGNQNSTSAATVIRRHYERYLLPYERHQKGEEHKPLPVLERRRLKSKQGSSSASDAETSESTSRSGNTTPVPSSSCSNPYTPDGKDSGEVKIKSEVKSSSLRSVRMKPERLREATKEKMKELNEIKAEDEKSDLANLCEKNAEPVTSAVAPIQKPASPEKASPVEGKENVPVPPLIANEPAGETPEVVPFKANTPEIIDLESDAYINNNKSMNVQCNAYVADVKKKKLDILKEGGLEVTPVQGYTPMERRPSVIQPVAPSVQIGNITVTADRRSMPPPANNPNPSKRSVQKRVAPVGPHTYLNGNLPPKVVQSNSIYIPTDKVTYGDPKLIPKFVGKTATTDVLDLTVKCSSKQPTIEILQVPAPPPAHQNPFKHTPLSSVDGRTTIGSNLEITLVNPSSKHSSFVSHYPNPYIPPPKPQKPHKRTMSLNDSSEPPPHITQKRSRTSSDIDVVMRGERGERGCGENGQRHYPPSYPVKENGGQDIYNTNTKEKLTHNPPNNKKEKILPPYPQYPNHHPPPTQPQMINNNKQAPIPPQNVELINQLYALQGYYQSHMPHVLPTQEQLQFYSELIAHTSRMRLPAYSTQYTQDSSPKKS